MRRFRRRRAPLHQYLAHVELLTGQLATCLDLDSLLDTALASLATLFEYAHAFVMVPDEAGGRLYTIKHYQSDDNIFVDDAYLIKGIAGRILWKLLRIYESEQRVQFANREIRLDGSLQLPDIKDNLEARLILLRRCLADKSEVLGLVPEGRGRFRLDVRHSLVLVEHS